MMDDGYTESVTNPQTESVINPQTESVTNPQTNCNIDKDTQPPEAVASQQNQRHEMPQETDSNIFQSFGNYVAAKLKKATSQQSIFAEKLIADVLQKAALGTLNQNTCLNDSLQYMIPE